MKRLKRVEAREKLWETLGINGITIKGEKYWWCLTWKILLGKEDLKKIRD